MPTFPGDTHSAVEWEQQKPKLQELYIQKRHSLREVQKMMANMTPAFRATDNQYKKKFQKWKWEKFPKTPKPSSCKPRAQPAGEHESTSSSAFDNITALPAATLVRGEPTQIPQPAKQINAFEALIELQEIMDEVTFSDHILQDKDIALSSSLAPSIDMSRALSRFLCEFRRLTHIIYMPAVNVDTNGVCNGAVFNIAGDISITRLGGSISSPAWNSSGYSQFQLLMVWDLRSSGLETPCRYLKTTGFFRARGDQLYTHEAPTKLIRLANEKAGKMYPGSCIGPRVLLLTSTEIIFPVASPVALLWKLFHNLTTANGELLSRGQLPDISPSGCSLNVVSPNLGMPRT